MQCVSWIELDTAMQLHSGCSGQQTAGMEGDWHVSQATFEPATRCYFVLHLCKARSLHSPLGIRHACQHKAVADLVVVQEALVLLVHLAGHQLACTQAKCALNSNR